MEDSKTPIVPRWPRDEQAPAAPLDPFVTQLVNWLAAHDDGVSLTGLPKQAAIGLEWPLPFAEAVVTAARTRRLLTLVQTTSRGGYRARVSKRGREWLERRPI
jgi:hypothetical protein